jgi:hypothetical protein
VQVDVLDARSPRAAQVWNSLPCHSYFLSWSWVENWLACLPADQAPALHVFDGRSAAFLTRRLALRHRVVPSRSLYLNTTGVYQLDDICSEYNGLAGADLSIDALVDALPGGWDELWLPAMRADAFGGLHEARRDRFRVRIDRTVPSYFVALADVRAKNFLALLSGQTRSQIKRAQKLAGELAVEVATDAGHARSIYDELATLHVAQWRAKGQPGAFADPWFDRFHRRLIAQRFTSGEIQLVRVRAGGETLGCLYNFVWGGRVLQYQTGFKTFDDGRMKPGLVCHAAVIDHCAAAGLEVYDLLGGEMRYKKSLSTGATSLVWARVQRRRPWFALEDRAVAFVRARRAAAAASSPTESDA